jgi:hypothetical protein
MKAEIETRILKRKKDLKTFETALEALNFKERSYAYIDGRLREIENEITWLKGFKGEG